MPALDVTGFEGTQREIGRAFGRRLATLPVPAATPEQIDFGRRCEEIVARHHPAAVERLEGMLEAGEVAPDDFRAFYFGRGGPETIGCTQFALLGSETEDGRTLVGRNYDWFFEAEPWREVRVIRPRDAFDHLSVSHHWAGGPDAVNDRGLLVILAALPHVEAEGPGLQWHVILDRVAETCATVPEAVEFLETVPHLKGFNYLVADAKGDGAVVEAAPGRTRVRRAESGLLIAANHQPGRVADAAELSRRGRARQRSSLARTAGVLGGLAGRPVTEADARRVLADHPSGICRGRHPSGDGPPGPTDPEDFAAVFGTLWSLLWRQGEPGLRVSAGHPCSSPYEPYALSGSGAPT